MTVDSTCPSAPAGAQVSELPLRPASLLAAPSEVWEERPEWAQTESRATPRLPAGRYSAMPWECSKTRTLAEHKNVPTLMNCTALCDAEPSCRGVNYAAGASRRVGVCELKFTPCVGVEDVRRKGPKRFHVRLFAPGMAVTAEEHELWERHEALDRIALLRDELLVSSFWLKITARPDQLRVEWIRFCARSHSAVVAHAHPLCESMRC